MRDIETDPRDEKGRTGECRYGPDFHRGEGGDAALILHPDSHAFERSGGNEVQKDFGASHPVEVVVDGFDRGLIGEAVEEFEGADRGVHRVRGENACRDPVIETRCRVVGSGR